jgi:hypothetical protein
VVCKRKEDPKAKEKRWWQEEEKEIGGPKSQRNL